MKLPVINVPTYTTTLLSTGQLCTYRPYTVKHEKILLIALESKDLRQIIDAVYNLIDECTEGVDPRTLPNFDLESLFVQIRSKSVGEGVELSMKCEECDGPTKCNYNLTDFQVEGEILKDVKVQINDSVGVALRYPSMWRLRKYLSEDVSNADQLLGTAISCIDYIYDDEQIYKADESSDEDLQEFLGSLTTDQFRQITNFIDKSPKLSKSVEFECSSCQHINKVKIEGLESFFM